MRSSWDSHEIFLGFSWDPHGILNGNGIFINLLHMIIQYSAVLLPPPPLISHRDQEKINKDMVHTDILL